MARHIEIHYLDHEADLGMLETAGLPRYDREPVACGSCHFSVGTVFNHQDEPVAWRAFGVVLDGNRIVTVCAKCLATVDKALAAS